jgi:hypothetical protein
MQAQSDFFWSIPNQGCHLLYNILHPETDRSCCKAHRVSGTIRTSCQGWGPFTWLQEYSRDLEEKMSSQVCAIDHFLAFSIPGTLIWRVMKIPYLEEHYTIGKLDNWLNYLAWSLCWHSLEKIKKIKYSISLFLFRFQLLFSIYLNIFQLLVVGVFQNLWILKLWFHIEVLQFMYSFYYTRFFPTAGLFILHATFRASSSCHPQLPHTIMWSLTISLLMVTLLFHFWRRWNFH